MKTIEKQWTPYGYCSATYTPWGFFYADTVQKTLVLSANYYSKNHN